MDLDFGDAIRIGAPTDLLEVQRASKDSTAVVPVSKQPRGLALRSLTVSAEWRGLWTMLRRQKQVYFLSTAFDLSGEPPVVMPPATLPPDAVHRVRRGETIEFTLGMGAPIYPPRGIAGGLIAYVLVCQADKASRHLGETLTQIHDDLARSGSLVDVVSEFAASPAASVATEILRVATAAMQPIATILKRNDDDFMGVFSGIFPAKGSWRDRLAATSNGTSIALVELR